MKTKPNDIQEFLTSIKLSLSLADYIRIDQMKDSGQIEIDDLPMKLLDEYIRVGDEELERKWPNEIDVNW